MKIIHLLVFLTECSFLDSTTEVTVVHKTWRVLSSWRRTEFPAYCHLNTAQPQPPSFKSSSFGRLSVLHVPFGLLHLKLPRAMINKPCARYRQTYEQNQSLSWFDPQNSMMVSKPIINRQAGAHR